MPKKLYLKMNKSNWLTLLGLLLYCILIFLPLLVHGYVYPNIGDDSAVYLARIEGMANGTDTVQYTGYYIAGYPMVFLRDTLGWSLDIQFLWFNFIALAFIGIVIYLVFAKLANRLTGWLALLLVMFTAQGIMFLFYYGQIFNIINLGIIFPLLLLFTVRYLEGRKKRYLLLTLVFTILFSSFHANGIYLPAIAGLGTLVYLIYIKFNKKTVQKRALYFGGGITLFAIIVFIALVVLPTMQQLREFSDTPLSSTMNNVGKGMAVPVNHWLMSILSPSILVLAALVAMFHKDLKKLFADNRVKMAGFILAVLSFLLIVAAFGKLSLDPWRQAVDLAIVSAMLVAVCLGVLLAKQKNAALYIVVVLAVGFGLFHNLPTWFNYNSAMTQADLKAIEYLNKVETFSCSSQVAPWVYMRYTTAKHQDNDGDIVIMRSEPMTPRSTEGNIWYQKHGWQPSLEYGLIATFTDNDVEVQVWELQDWARLKRLLR